MAHFSPIRRAVESVIVSHKCSLRWRKGRCRTGVASDVVGADRKIGNLEVLDAMDVQALVQDTVLDDAVALLRSHRACLQICQ